MEKAYEPSKYEPTIRQLWQSHHSFALGSNISAPDSTPFTIIMPPPNANGSLHSGHLMYVVEDIMTRYARMQGRPTLWQPGTDHAGIETQFVYEKELAKSGKSRHDLGQAQFYTEVWDFVEAHKGTMIEQMQSMGFSADWGKLKYTLDTDITDIVLDTFKQLHDDGFIYRGNRIVNWDPVTRSAYADIELKYIERTDELYTLNYGTVQIATTRPETIFADSAIAVNPDDERYRHLIGTTATIPLVNRPIPIIADAHVDPSFGTGALKVTPGHDKNDYEIGLTHNLPQLTVIDFDGNMINVPEEYAGLSVEAARTLVVSNLEKSSHLVKREPITHSVAIQDRSGAVIEPLITEQWFLRVAELNKPVIAAIESEQVKIYPRRFKKIALEWLKNEHDWCISRQIWWGIRIPVYYKTSHDVDKQPYLIAKDEAEAIAYYGEGNYRAETDTFDTWFSSGQWPYATLMTSLGQDWKNHYPTSVMATARDILHKWVTRMIMFSLYKTGQVPFENVYLWGMVTDEKGQKLSKSKGNYTDPMQITAKYGTDALRLALSIGITPGNDGKLSEEKIRGYRNFCNKLWNTARFVLSRLDENYSPKQPELISPADHFIVEKSNIAIKAVTKHLNNYRFSEAGEAIYHLLWNEFADCYIEYAKQSLNPEVLTYVLDVILRLAHPFAPFVTEAIWQELPWTESQLITEHWPNTIIRTDAELSKQFDLDIHKILAQKQADESQALRTKLERELAAKHQHVKLIEAKLANKDFVSNAPTAIVKAERDRLKAVNEDITAITKTIEQL
ncbi:valine--tRNA ligase [Candidatus Saccharibacteria bacterium]|nr:valine--tRNA ligase [Candidatus Saccharibacteria bacterium]